MLYNILKLIHVLSIVIWIGGMFFAHFCLRPAVARIDAPPVRLTLMHDVLGRFFNIVGVVALLSLVSGGWMMGRVAKQTVQSGGQFTMPLSWTLMASLGVVMILIFGHIRFALYKRLSRAVAAKDWPAGGAALASIRRFVAVNLVIGVLIVAVILIG
jgi:uncharacterized membrane protein